MPKHKKRVGLTGDRPVNGYPKPPNGGYQGQAKRQRTPIVSGKAVYLDVKAKTPNEWLDPGWKLFMAKRYKRFSTD